MQISQERLTIEETLKLNGVYMGPTTGISMEPMLKHRRDTIVVRPKVERLKPLDVALYKRGNSYVLHRVISVIDGGYIIRGDNLYNDEIVPEDTVIGVLTEFFRKNKHFLCTNEKYLKYAQRRVKTYKFRRVFWLIKVAGVKVLRALKIKK